MIWKKQPIANQLATLNSNKAGISKAYTFNGTPDDNGFIVTDLPLSSPYCPVGVINVSRIGWMYLFTKYTNISVTYWCVHIRNATTNATASSGEFSGTIVAVG